MLVFYHEEWRWVLLVNGVYQLLKVPLYSYCLTVCTMCEYMISLNTCYTFIEMITFFIFIFSISVVNCIGWLSDVKPTSLSLDKPLPSMTCYCSYMLLDSVCQYFLKFF